MSHPTPVVLTCDLGGSGFRAALIDADGGTHAEVSKPFSVSPDARGFSEIDAATWWNALVDCASALITGPTGRRCHVKGVAVCGFTRTQVLIGGSGEVLRPAILWNDTRAEETATGLKERLSKARIDGTALNAFHPLARLQWVADHEPGVMAKLTAVIEPKDYLNFRLTGHISTDIVSMTPLARITKAIQKSSAEGLSNLDFPFPSPRNPIAVAGTVRRDVPPPLQPLVGTPVFNCSHDSWASAVGLGALQDGGAYNLTGTSEVFGVFSTRHIEAEGLLTVDWGGLYHLGGPSQNGGDVYRWLQSILLAEPGDGRGREASVDALLTRTRHRQPLLFLPFLQGERVPYWNPSLRGAFVGLSRQHTATDMAFGVLEGVAYVNREVIHRAETSLHQTVTEQPPTKVGGFARVAED